MVLQKDFQKSDEQTIDMKGEKSYRNDNRLLLFYIHPNYSNLALYTFVGYGLAYLKHKLRFHLY